MVVTVSTSPSVPLVIVGSAKIVVPNDKRVGLAIYNNSANSIFCKYGSAGNTGTSLTFPVLAFSTWWMPLPIFPGEIWACRDAGSGACSITELSLE